MKQEDRQLENKTRNQRIILWISVVFGVMALLAILHWVPVQEGNLDSKILLFLQEKVRNPVLTPIMTGITTLGNAGAIWILITVVLCIPKKTRRVGIISLCALIGSLIVNNLILKNLVGRIRPYEVIGGLYPLIEKQVDASFPSGHTGASFASGWVLFRNLPGRFGVPALILAIAIAFSRLYVGVHYPTDVLAGMIIGIGLAHLAELLVTGWEKRNTKNKV